MKTNEEVRLAKEEMVAAFEKWNFISVIEDPEWEEVAWLDYSAKAKRFEALYKEQRKKRKLELVVG